MITNFPDAPTTNGQTYVRGDLTWVWDGVKWAAAGATMGGTPFLPLSGGTVNGDLVVAGGFQVGEPLPSFFANVPASVVTAAPVLAGSDPHGGSVALLVIHDTGTTPSTTGMFGGYFTATQNTASAATSAQDIGYVGAVVQGTATVTEGAFDTTVAAPAIHGDLTLTVANGTGFDPGVGFVIVHDRGSAEGNTVVSRAGNVITLANLIDWPVSVGNLVYVPRGTVRGLSGQATVFSGVTGMYQFTAELATQANAGSRPYAKANLLLSVNALNQESARGPYEAGLMLSAQSGAVLHKNGIAFAPISGQHMVQATGTLIKTIGGSFGSGLDLSLADFAGNAIATPGFRVDGDGTLHLENIAPTLVFQDTNQPPETGLWRMTLVPSTGQMVVQENLAPAGDFSSSRILWLLDAAGYGKLNGPNPGLWLNDQDQVATTGGLWRMYSASSQLAFQTNTAAAEDFSTSTTALTLRADGKMVFGVLPVNATNDAGASAAGVPVGGVYRNGSVLQIRVA